MILTNYWWLILWPILMGPILALILPKTEVSVFGITLERWPLVAVWILVLPYIFWCMNRSEFAGYRSVQKYVFGSTVAGISIHKLFIRAYQGSWLFYPHLASETLDRQ